MTAGEKVAPPSVDSKSPIFAPPGGENRPPLTEETPWRATSVPIKIWLALPGSIAIAPIERPVATEQVLPDPSAQGAFAAVLPATSVQLLPPLIDLYRPTPASESLEPFGSPVPT